MFSENSDTSGENYTKKKPVSCQSQLVSPEPELVLGLKDLIELANMFKNDSAESTQSSHPLGVPKTQTKEENKTKMSDGSSTLNPDVLKRIRDLALAKNDSSSESRSVNPYTDMKPVIQKTFVESSDDENDSDDLTDSDDAFSSVSKDSFTTALETKQPPLEPKSKKNLQNRPSSGKQPPLSSKVLGKGRYLEKFINKKIPTMEEARAMGLDKKQLGRRVTGVALIAGNTIKGAHSVKDIIKFGQKHSNAKAIFVDHDKKDLEQQTPGFTDEFSINPKYMGLAIGANGTYIQKVRRLEGITAILVKGESSFCIEGETPQAVQMARSQLEFDEKSIMVKKNLVGKIIGKNGVGIQEIQEKCNLVRVIVKKPDEIEESISKEDLVPLTLVGTLTSIAEAEVLLEKYLGNANEASQFEEELTCCTEEFCVPDELLGLAIGADGANLQKVKNLGGITKITREGRKFKIYGETPTAVQKARAMLEFKKDFLLVKKGSVGQFLAQNKKVIHEIKEKCGAVRLNAEEESPTGYLLFAVVGNAEAIGKAKILLTNLLEEIEKKEKFHETFTVETELMRYAIGSKGANIQAARKVDGVSKIVHEGNTFTVYGENRKAVEMARAMLEIREEFVLIESHLVRRVIGRLGLVIKEVIEKSGVFLLKIEEGEKSSLFRSTNPHTARIVGTTGSIKLAKQMLNILVE